MERRTAIKWLSGAPFFAGSMWAESQSLAGQSLYAPLRLSTFAANITPALGTPLCGGWITPAQSVDDPLSALGIVLTGGEKPIVLCALDWVETNNASYDAWRQALAAAAGTDPSYVAVQCVHPHDTPWANLPAHQMVQHADEPLELMHPPSFHDAIQFTAEAVKASLAEAVPITHLGIGQATVHEVASARRILGPDGKVQYNRTSTCTNPQARACPEGKIDPYLKTVSFWNEDQPVAALHYYATHPMSHYGDGRISCDFCGLARTRRQQEMPTVFQVYFTGCAGDITAGKYNDGSPEMREIFTDRVHAAMVAAWKETECIPLQTAQWSVEPVVFEPRDEPEFREVSLRAKIADPERTLLTRLRSAINLSWLNRIDKPVEISCLRLGDVRILHLPGEPFVHYQFLAQQTRSEEFVCVAGYGDGGMGYIPQKKSYHEGGYEPTMSFVAPSCEEILTAAIRRIMA